MSRTRRPRGRRGPVGGGVGAGGALMAAGNIGSGWTPRKSITILHSVMANRLEAVDLDRERDTVHQAYTATAERVLTRGFRDNPTYIATKALVDWDLLE